MFYYQNQNQKNFFGVSNEGKCVKPAICKQVIILNENLFAWESDNGSKAISNKDGRDITPQQAPLHFVTKDFIVSHVYNYTNKNNVTMMPIGFRVDGTKMSEMEVDSITSIVNYDTRVDFSNGINIDTANRVQVVNSNHLFEQSKLSSMKR